MSKYSKDALSKRLGWEGIDPKYLERLIALAKNEDLQGFGLKHKQYTAHDPNHPSDPSAELISNPKKGRANIVAREAMVICGLKLIPIITSAYAEDCTFYTELNDGHMVEKGAVIGILEGSSNKILMAERVLLNFIQHLSGIATTTQLFSHQLAGSPTRLLDTRKTTPGYRVLEKYAFMCGGGYNHRYGLFDRVMIKDNHLAIFQSDPKQSLNQVILKARERYPELPIQVEVDCIEQIDPVLKTGVDCILLDNFSDTQLIEAIEQIGDSAFTEASGGIKIERLEALKNMGLDFISTGAPVHQSRWVDIALDWS